MKTVKATLSENTSLAYLDHKKHTEIHVDASPVGIAGILSQNGRPVAYASRSLTSVEQRYSQTEREALVVWSCEHFNVYISGVLFTVVTDHRPLLFTWDKPSPPTRIARWALRLQPYAITMQYTTGKDNSADYMSRHPSNKNIVSSRQEKMAEQYVNFILDSDVPTALTLEEIQSATAQYPTLQTVIKNLNTGRWQEMERKKLLCLVQT